jgi:hypothetical protein
MDEWSGRSGSWPRRLEWLGVTLLFAFFAGQDAPAVNEAHYLAKARHFWDPAWCGRDLFLRSRDAHQVFAATIGWLALLVPLPVVAWIGRCVTWAALAAGWQRLSGSLFPRPGAALLSASLWLTLLDHGTMAGEWVVGGVEAKCWAYAAVLFALECFLSERWNRGLAWLGLATCCHVLVGGWSLIAAAAAWFGCGPFRPAVKTLWPGFLAAGLLSLPGLVPALLLTAGTEPSVAADAAWIYVYGRLSHHLVFHRLDPYAIAAFAGVLVAWVAAATATPCDLRPGHLGQRPLRGFVGGAVAIAAAGVLVDQLLLGHWELSAKLLRYYWFRLADAMLPGGAALAVVGVILGHWRSRPRLARGLLAAVVPVAVAGVIAGSLQHGALSPNLGDPQWNWLERERLLSRGDRPRVARQWRETCQWIRDNTPADSLWLTPRHQQTFKWLAQRAEAVNGKDVPQDAAAVVEWQDRREALFPPETGVVGLTGLGERRLIELARRYGAEYVVVDEFLGKRQLALPAVYPLDDTPTAFRVYRVASP